MMSITPCYVVDYYRFRHNCLDIETNFSNCWGRNLVLGYSVKTNHYTGLIKYAYEKLGWYIETVSPYEYNSVLNLGIPSDRIILNGPNKEEILHTALKGKSIVNIDNLDEINRIQGMDLRNAAIGLRVNFDLEKKCPGETTAGDEVSRFGIDVSSLDFNKAVKALQHMGVNRFGLHMHSSTKTRSIKVFQAIAEQVVDIITKTSHTQSGTRTLKIQYFS